MYQLKYLQLKDHDNCSRKIQTETFFGMTLDKYRRSFMCIVNPNENYNNHFLNWFNKNLFNLFISLLALPHSFRDLSSLTRY